MSAHIKLMQARVKLQNMKLAKTGHNKFAGYYYFELGDFLPQVQEIFAELGLCGVVSYSPDTASLNIVDTEDSTTILITSPMGSAALKGCHEVQNIGAVETYQRRYLWVTAMEIVEHDALDATVGSADGKKEKPKASISPNDVGKDYHEAATGDEKTTIDAAVLDIQTMVSFGDAEKASKYFYTIGTQEQMAAVWSQLNSKERAEIKRFKNEMVPA